MRQEKLNPGFRRGDVMPGTSPDMTRELGIVN